MISNDRVLLVANPISGGMDKSEIIGFLENIFAHEKKILFVYHTTGKDDRQQLEKIVEEFKPERVLVIGGDGTIKLLAEILKNYSIPMGLFPAGSANGLAENFNLPIDLKEKAKVALGNSFMNVDCININDELCLHISDIGLNAELIKNYEQGNIRGKLGYFLHSIPTLIKSNFPFRFNIHIGDHEYKRAAVLIAIANAKKYGTGASINPDGKLDDGQFELLVFKKFNIPQILRTFQENSTPSKDFLEIFPAKQVFIETDKPLPFQIDGEYRGEINSIKAEISDVNIKMAVPGRSFSEAK